MDRDVDHDIDLLMRERGRSRRQRCRSWRRGDLAGRSARPRPGTRSPSSRSTPSSAGRDALLLAAGAGSGKTAVLVERFVRAVLVTMGSRRRGSSRSRSPTGPPASSRSGCAERFLELGEREQARDVEAAIVGTFHTFCARLLRLAPARRRRLPGFPGARGGAGGAPARAMPSSGRSRRGGSARGRGGVEVLASLRWCTPARDGARGARRAAKPRRG